MNMLCAVHGLYKMTAPDDICTMVDQVVALIIYATPCISNWRTVT